MLTIVPRSLTRLLAPTALGLALLGACKEPPASDERVPPPSVEREQREQRRIEAYREALERAVPSVRAALVGAAPLTAYQIGQGPAAGPLLDHAQRRELDGLARPAREALGELDEAYLPGAEVVVLRTMRFALDRLNDELTRRPRASQDPMVGIQAIADTIDELRYRLFQADCDATCEALPRALVDELDGAQRRLTSASIAGSTHAGARARALADELRALASKPLLDERARLRTGLIELASACDEHGAWLEQLAADLAERPAGDWLEKTPQQLASADAPLTRLPDILGERAMIRRLSVEERLDLAPGPAFAEIERHVGRWQRLHQMLVDEGEVPTDDEPAPVDAARCEAALGRVETGLAAVPDIDVPRFDCARYLALLGDERRSEAQLVLDVLDLGVIEPQRRALRSTELPELALVAGQWSAWQHIHLRRVMILARLSEHLPEPGATALALSEGRRALCWAEAALWIHAQLGPSDEVALTVGEPCSELGDAAAITARVTGDPRGAMAGFGLSLIGDEPARMVGFDRFFWAPLGLMKMLATPKGMHPDQFSLPDDPTSPSEAPSGPKLEIELEEL